MVSKVSQNYQNAYIQKQFSRLPNAEKGNTRQVSAGENLWSIAKSELGENASNKEINDYVFLIAKVNDLNNDKKMNNIRTNTNLYMPKVGKPGQKSAQIPVQVNSTAKEAKQQSAPAKPVSVKSVPKRNIPNIPEVKQERYVVPSDRTTVARNQFLTVNQKLSPLSLPETVETEVVNNVQKEASPSITKSEVGNMKTIQTLPKQVKPTEKKRNSVEKTFVNTLEMLRSDPTVKVEPSSVKLTDRKMYYVTRIGKGVSGQNIKKTMMTFNVKGGKVDELTFEGENDINPNGHDYVINNNGKNPSQILTRPYLTMKTDVVGQVSPEEFQAVSSILLGLIK